MAFGGAGPTHAPALMGELGVPAIPVPLVPRTLSALGLLVTDLRHDYAAPYLKPETSARPDEVAAIFARLEESGRTELAEDGVSRDAMTITRP